MSARRHAVVPALSRRSSLLRFGAIRGAFRAPLAPDAPGSDPANRWLAVFYIVDTAAGTTGASCALRAARLPRPLQLSPRKR